MDSQRYYNMGDAYRKMYLSEAEKPEGGKPGHPPHYYPVPPFGRRPAMVVKNTTNVSIDLDTKDAVGPGEVEKAYYTYSAGFDPTNREDVAKKDYDGSKTRSESSVTENVDLDDELLINVCDYLIQKGFTLTSEGAEAMYNHMSDEWKSVIIEKADDNGNTACWDSHKKVGMKKKGGKMVNDCVPK